jgi:hypothetical protein
MEELVGTQSKVFGPNCYNTALRVSGILQDFRFVSEGEFWFWMKSPFCRQRKTGEHQLLATASQQRLLPLRHWPQ